MILLVFYLLNQLNTLNKFFTLGLSIIKEYHHFLWVILSISFSLSNTINTSLSFSNSGKLSIEMKKFMFGYFSKILS